MTIALVLLGTAGSLLSLHAALAAYGRVTDGPAACADDGTACDSVFRTPAARIFGVPNAVIGLGYYALVITGALLGTAASAAFVVVLRAAGVSAVAVGIYLSYQLLFRLRMSCPVCFASHALNASILILLFLYA